MTYNEIYTNFMIEYDKANVTSSYPSLTEKEACVLLDKAYLALIAQKITGNNVRRSTFESDIKSISDLQGLLFGGKLGKVEGATEFTNSMMFPTNMTVWELPDKFMYYIQSTVKYTDNNIAVCKLVTHDMAQRFFQTDSNNPWIKNPVCFVESGFICLLVDPTKDVSDFSIRCIKTPDKFEQHIGDNVTDKEFDCTDTVAEELISLAIVFALENIESQRLTSKLNTKGLEA